LTKRAQKTTNGHRLPAIANATLMQQQLAVMIKHGIPTAAAAETALKFLVSLTNSSTQSTANANASLLAAMLLTDLNLVMTAALVSPFELGKSPTTHSCYVR